MNLLSVRHSRREERKFIEVYDKDQIISTCASGIFMQQRHCEGA